MLVASFPALAFATNCYVIAPAAGEECVIVDPGVGVESQLAEILVDHRLRPAAVLLTHGHIDHVYSVTPVCGAAGVAAYIHEDDRYRLRDPLASLAPSLVAMLEQQYGRAVWRDPEDVVTFGAEAHLDLAGLRIGVLHAPGHTEGSVIFTLDGVPDGVPDGASAHGGAELTSTVLSGDVLFAGSIGRSDLEGGDPAAMHRSLRDVVLPLPDPTLVLPGHGPATTIARERTGNPHLQGLTP